MGYNWNCLDEHVLLAGLKLLLIEFGILHRLESCVQLWLLIGSIFKVYMNCEGLLDLIICSFIFFWQAHYWEQCHLNLNLICSHLLQCAKQESKSCIVFGCVLFKALRHVFYNRTMTYSMPCLKVCLLIAICLLIRTRECALQSRHPNIKKTQYSLP